MGKYNADKVRKIEKALFSSKKITLTPAEQELKTKIETVFTRWLSDPSKTDNEMKLWIQNQLQLDKQEAYRLMYFTKMLMGNVQVPAKQWHRYQVIQMLLEAYNKARDKNDLGNMIAAADKIGKYTKLDKDEDEDLGFDKIFVPEFEMTTDASAAGFKPISEETKAKLRKKYLGDMDDLEEAEVIS